MSFDDIPLMTIELDADAAVQVMMMHVLSCGCRSNGARPPGETLYAG